MTIIYHNRFLEHRQTFGHPERPERLEHIVKRLKQEHLFTDVLKPESAGEEELTSVHTREYVDLIKNYGEGYLDPDTYHREETYEIAALAAGGGIEAAKLAYEKCTSVFALLRPPGHHAGTDHSGGFCYFNNIALGARSILPTARRVAIVDIDVHHGNGTNDIFYENPEVLYISTHQWGIYPGTGSAEMVGEGDGEGYTVNIPFSSGAGDTTYSAAYEGIIEPILTQFKPSALLVSIGTDAHYVDPLATLTLSSRGYLSIINRIMKLSKKICKGRLAFFLEGGYDLRVLAEIVSATIARFRGRELELQFTKIMDTKCVGGGVVERVKSLQGEYWDL